MVLLFYSRFIYLQVQLREEISRLRDIKQLMDCAKRDGVDELPDWLNETGELHALLDEAKHDVSCWHKPSSISNKYCNASN